MLRRQPDRAVSALAKVEVAEVHDQALLLHHVPVLLPPELADARNELEQLGEAMLMVVRVLTQRHTHTHTHTQTRKA